MEILDSSIASKRDAEISWPLEILLSIKTLIPLWRKAILRWLVKLDRVSSPRKLKNTSKCHLKREEEDDPLAWFISRNGKVEDNWITYQYYLVPLSVSLFLPFYIIFLVPSSFQEPSCVFLIDFETTHFPPSLLPYNNSFYKVLIWNVIKQPLATLITIKIYNCKTSWHESTP